MAPLTSEERIDQIKRELNDFKEALSETQRELEKLDIDAHTAELEKAITTKFSFERQAISNNLKEEIDTYLTRKESEQLKLATARAQDLENKFNVLQKQLENIIQNISTKALSDLETKTSAEFTAFSIERKSAFDGFSTESSTLLKEFISEKATNFSKLSTDIANFQEDYKRKQEALIKKTEEILAVASSAALSTSFNEEKKDRRQAQNITLFCFSIVIIGMVCIPVLLYKFNIIDVVNWKTQPELVFFAFLKTAALEWPLVWIARLLSKKMQIQQEIYEEYAHKYSVALAYSAMRKDIKEFHDTDYELSTDGELKSFTGNFANATFVNPTRVFNRIVNTENPIDNASSTAKEIVQSSKEIINP